MARKKRRYHEKQPPWRGRTATWRAAKACEQTIKQLSAALRPSADLLTADMLYETQRIVEGIQIPPELLGLTEEYYDAKFPKKSNT